MKRIEWLDVAKAIAIMAVITGHSFLDRSLVLSVLSAVFVLFWIVAGYTIKPCNGVRGLINCTLKDFSKMIIPAFFVCLFSGVLATITGEYCDWNALLNNLKQSGLLFISSNPGMLWFFWALLWAKLLYRILLKMGYFRYIPMIILIALSLIYSPEHRLPLMVDMVPVGVLFMELGHLLKGFDEKTKSLSKSVYISIIVIAAAISLVASYYLTWQRRLYVDLSGRDYTVPAILQCICVMILALIVCRLISNTPAVGLLSELGQHTLGLLFLHFLDGHWISPIAEALFRVIGFSNDYLFYGIRVILLLLVLFICVKIQDRFFYYINYGKH